MNDHNCKAALDRRLARAVLPDGVKEALRAQAGSAPAPRARRPVRRAVLVGAAAVLLLTFGALAANGTAAYWLHSLFSSTPDSLLESLGTPLDASDTDHGITVQAKAVISDGRRTCVALAVTPGDTGAFPGIPDARLSFSNLHVTLDRDEPTTGYGMSSLQRIPGTDTWQTILEIQHEGSTTVPGQVSCTMDGIFAYGDDYAVRGQPVDGHWALTFPLSTTDTARRFQAGQQVETDGRIQAHFTSIEVSPLGMDVAATLSFRSGGAYDGIRDPQLVRKDGSVVEDYTTVGSLAPGEGKDGDYTWHIRFGEITPLSEAAALKFGDATIPLTPQES